MNDDISSQGLTQVRLCYFVRVHCILMKGSLDIQQIFPVSVCSKLCKKGDCATPRNLYTRDTSDTKNASCTQRAWIHSQGKHTLFKLLSSRLYILGSRNGFLRYLSAIYTVYVTFFFSLDWKYSSSVVLGLNKLEEIWFRSGLSFSIVRDLLSLGPLFLFLWCSYNIRLPCLACNVVL